MTSLHFVVVVVVVVVVASIYVKGLMQCLVCDR